MARDRFVAVKTPMMRQYLQLKQQIPDALLLLRMGDFYELFFGDATEAARLLGLTITNRCAGGQSIAMAGFPHAMLGHYKQKLLAAGLRFAVCEQVDRETIRVTTDPMDISDPPSGISHR